MVAVLDNTVAARDCVLSMTGSCYADTTSGELVLARMVGDVVILSDEYGADMVVSQADFDRQYAPSSMCPILVDDCRRDAS